MSRGVWRLWLTLRGCFKWNLWKEARARPFMTHPVPAPYNCSPLPSSRDCTARRRHRQPCTYEHLAHPRIPTRFKQSLLASSLHVQTLLAFSRFLSGLSQRCAHRYGECSSRLPPRATERAAQGEPGPEPAGAPSPVRRKSCFVVRRAGHSAPPSRRACIQGGTAALRAPTAGSPPPRAPSHPELRRPPGRTPGTGGK